MKRFISKVLIFLLILSVSAGAYVFAGDKAASYAYGPNTKTQIDTSFINAVSSDYDCYFLGNSRIYHGINPDKIAGVKAYNFAYSNDTYNQMYYKLLYLQKNGKKFEKLIIGTDYFQFSFLADDVNFVYDSKFGKEYIKDYSDSYFDEICNNISHIWQVKKLLLFESVKECIANRGGQTQKSFLKSNGQYIMPGEATPDDTISRDKTVLDVQLDYYKKIVDFCDKSNIELFVIMPPVRDGEMSSYTADDLKKFDSMILSSLPEKFRNNYLNFADVQEFKSYKYYTDITHLNEQGAELFSEYLSGKLNF